MLRAVGGLVAAAAVGAAAYTTYQQGNERLVQEQLKLLMAKEREEKRGAQGKNKAAGPL